ncbi:hypothetical protein M3Y99_01020800 [Aphelenchoides fujianensis]|nr:hypothetical protein M3Y99_01020800 [Aphelenchoides fujianensis]
MDAYKDEQEASFTGGLLLIGSSVLAGWLLESGFNRWTRKVNGWRSLLAVLFVGYAANLTAIHQFEQQSVDLLSGSPPSAEWKAEMRAEIAAVWANRKAWAAMPVRDVLDFNLRMQRFAMYSGGCEDESDSLPSHHRPNISFLQYICKDKFLKDYCADFMLRELPLTLAQWKEPIDVLFVMIGTPCPATRRSDVVWRP